MKKTAIEFLKGKGILKAKYTHWIVKFSEGEEFDIVELLREFAKMKCEEQRIKVGSELTTWTEDLSIPNQNKIYELCENADEPEF